METFEAERVDMHEVGLRGKLKHEGGYEVLCE